MLSLFTTTSVNLENTTALKEARHKGHIVNESISRIGKFKETESRLGIV